MNECLFFLHLGVILLSIYVFSKFEKVGLFVIFILQLILANLFLLKQMNLFGVTVTTTDCYAVGSIFTLNLIREIYGKKATHQAISLGLFSILFVPTMSFFLLSYIPTPSCTMHQFYLSLFSPSVYIFCISTICMVVTQKLDTFLFANLRKKYSFAISMVAAISLSQLFDTFVFTYTALHGYAESLLSIALFSYAVKMMAIFTMSISSKKMARSLS